MDYNHTTKNMVTPSSLRKRFQKLSLRKAALSCPRQLPLPPICCEGRDASSHSMSPTHQADEDFTTPPFVTKRRPKYTSSTFTQLSLDLDQVSPDLMISECLINNQFENNTNMASHSTPITGREPGLFHLSDVAKESIEIGKDSDCIDKTEENTDYKNGINSNSDSVDRSCKDYSDFKLMDSSNAIESSNKSYSNLKTKSISTDNSEANLSNKSDPKLNYENGNKSNCLDNLSANSYVFDELDQKSSDFKVNSNSIDNSDVIDELNKDCSDFKMKSDSIGYFSDKVLKDGIENENCDIKSDCKNNLDGVFDEKQSDEGPASDIDDDCKNETCLSPKTANIMDDMYGNVWRNTPGLFKKSKSVVKNRQTRLDSDYDDVLNKLDSLNLYVRTLTDVKAKPNQHQTSIHKYFKSTTKDLKTSFTNVHGEILKPKVLSFDSDDELITNEDVLPYEVKNKDISDLVPCPDSEDSSLNFKNTKKKNCLISSSDSDKENVSVVIIDSDDNGTKSNKTKNRLSKKLRDARRSRMHDRNSFIVINSDTDDKNVKTGRKLLRRNHAFDDVEFVCEVVVDRGRDRVFEIVDDRDKANMKNFNNIYKTDDTSDDFITDGIKNISLKPKDINVVPGVGKAKSINGVNKISLKTPDKKKTRKKKAINDAEKENVDLNNIQRYSFMASLNDNVPSWRCDKEAAKYRDKFSKHKNELVQILFKMFNERVYDRQIDPQLSIVWNTNLLTTAGRANNKMVRPKGGAGSEIARKSTVELSTKVLDSALRLRNTLAHELCHVAAWLIDHQLRDGHGPCWRKWVAKTLQAFPELEAIPVRHHHSIHHKYTYKCTKCGYSVDRHSKSIDVAKKRCGYCYGTLECMRNKKGAGGLMVSTPVGGARPAAGFALYVKEHYGDVRSGNTPHKQAMKLLGRQYAMEKGATAK